MIFQLLYNFGRSKYSEECIYRDILLPKIGVLAGLQMNYFDVWAVQAEHHQSEADTSARASCEISSDRR